jgi:adenosylmethionine-8-amino-7-oxononanoate aminotransferase
LCGPNAKAAPYIHDIRGGGLFWGIEFSYEVLEAESFDFKGDSIAMLVQARALENGIVIMGFTGGSNLEGTKGDHLILAPAYNVKKEEIEMTVDILVQSVEEILTEAKSA